MRFKPLQSASLFTKFQLNLKSEPSFSPFNTFIMASQIQTLSSQTPATNADNDGDDTLCSSAHIERAWAHWNSLGRPKLIVAPMVDNSELPFRMLCRKYGAQAAYTPMLHSRIFGESEKYRSEEFTTCKEDRPLFVQFCANDPDILLESARKVEPYCDYVDINFG
ncbi:hypothetical protein MIMGU_mgv1a0074382mg, partial [Erythranthe guttata]